MSESVLLSRLSKEVDMHHIKGGLVLIHNDSVIEIRNKTNLIALKQYIENILGEEDWVR